MSAQQAERPPSGLALVRRDSKPLAVGTVSIGAASLLIFLLGTFFVLLLHGFTPLEDLQSGLRSHELDAVLATSMILGVVAIVLGFTTFKSMPTKVSREESIAGAVLGIQTIVLAALLFWFENGDRVELFTLNYLNLEVLGPLLGDFANGAKNTLILALTSEFFGIVLGLALAMFAISKRAVVRAPARAYINFFRGTPLVWQLIVIGIGIPIGLGIRVDPYLAGIIAFSLNAAAYLAEVFRAGIQSIERGQFEAARGLGMSYLESMRYAIVPQAIRRVIPPLMNEFVILVKDTSLIIFLGLTSNQRDLMSVGNFEIANSFNATPLLMTALGYLAITLPAIRLVNFLERKLRSGLIGVSG